MTGGDTHHYTIPDRLIDGLNPDLNMSVFVQINSESNRRFGVKVVFIITNLLVNERKFRRGY